MGDVGPGNLVTVDAASGGQDLATMKPTAMAKTAGVRALRVLIAESNSHVRDVLTWALGHDPRFAVVAAVTDGDSALACPDEFDVALVDLGIHGRGGLGTISNLCQRTPAPAVVVLSRFDAVYLRHAAHAEGAADFVVISEGLEHLGDRLEMAGRGMAPVGAGV